jgi:hypothetical protein
MLGTRPRTLLRAVSKALVGTILLLTACALLSCRHDPTGADPDANPVFPPTLPRPQVRTTVAFGSPADSARYAGYVVIGHLNQVRLEFGAFDGHLGTFQTLPYVQISETEWMNPANTGVADCQIEYWIEKQPVSLRWNCYWIGNCEVPHPSFPSPVLAMETSLDGNTGQLDILWLWDRPGTGRVTWESDLSAGQRTFHMYERRNPGPILLATLVIRDLPNGDQETELTRSGEYHWWAHVSGDRRSGSFRLDRPGASGSDWAVTDEISWAGGHGSWTAHPISGDVEQRNW